MTVGLHPICVRGEAYLAAHEGRKAAGEFQKIIDHRVLVLNPVEALARLDLARAFALQNDTVKAKAAYQDFLALWKDADPDTQILKQAKAEYSRLQYRCPVRLDFDRCPGIRGNTGDRTAVVTPSPNS